MNVEYRMSKECILPVVSLCVERSILKKTEQSETTLRYSAVRCSNQVKFHTRLQSTDYIAGGNMQKRDHPTTEDLQKQLEMYQLIFDSIYNGAVVTDIDGRITHFNKPYGAFLGVDPEDQIGRHCTESVDNSRMHIVARTGQPEINQSHRIRGQNMVVQRIPIKNDGEVIAVFGQVMFKDVKDVRKLAS